MTNQLLFDNFDLTDTRHNYVKKINKMTADGKFDFMKANEIYHHNVYHDDWCGIYKGMVCDCNPDIETITHKEYLRRQARKLY